MRFLRWLDDLIWRLRRKRRRRETARIAAMISRRPTDHGSDRVH